MRRLFAVAMVCTLLGLVHGFYLRRIWPTALASDEGKENCATKNGDVNADGLIDISDAITTLNFLFLGSPRELLPFCTTPSAPLGLPATGQTKCYGGAEAEIPCDNATCPGQDGSYETGCPSAFRFEDNGDGTLTDMCTGLMWQKDTADVNGNGQLTNQDSLPWCEALTFCENLSFAGHDDWRLPNVRELLSIVDYGRSDVAIIPGFSAISGGYWSSTTNANNHAEAWIVFFDGGNEPDDGGDSKAMPRHVRAVRTAP